MTAGEPTGQCTILTLVLRSRAVAIDTASCSPGSFLALGDFQSRTLSYIRLLDIRQLKCSSCCEFAVVISNALLSANKLLIYYLCHDPQPEKNM